MCAYKSDFGYCEINLTQCLGDFGDCYFGNEIDDDDMDYEETESGQEVDA